MLKRMIIIFSSLNAGFHKNVLGNPYFERSCPPPKRKCKEVNDRI